MLSVARFVWLIPLMASWIHAVWMYSILPDRVPVHWNAAGQIDRYGSRSEAAFLLPALCLIIVALMWFGGAMRRRPGFAELILTGMFGLQLLTAYWFSSGRLVPQLLEHSGWWWLILPALSWLLAVLSYPYMPKRVPIHWGIQGEADAFANRAVGVFMMPGLLTVMAAVLLALGSIPAVMWTLGLFLLIQIPLMIAQLRSR
jgi:uncharacterized membrane protein